MLELNKETFQEMINGDLPLLVDFWAAWCMPCKVFAPALEDLADELDGKVNFAKLNIDDFPELATQYGIVSIPTIILFKGGKPVTQMVGVQPKDAVLRGLSAHI